MKARALVLTLITAAILVPAILQPAAKLVERSLEGSGLARFATILSEPAYLRALGNSLWLSVLTVVACAIVGVTLALLARDLGSGGRWLSRIALAPLFLSPVLGTMAFHFLFGRGGVVRHLFPGLDYGFRGIGAALVIHVLTMFVYFFLFVSAALTRLDWDLLNAARSLGASRMRAFFTVLLPLLRPALVGAAALTFMASMASFTAPYLFGGDERYLTTAIYVARLDDPPTAAALSILLAAASLACAWGFLRRGGGDVQTASKGTPPARATGSRFSIALRATLATLIVAATFLPLATLVLLSFKPGGRIGTEPLFSDLTTTHYRAIASALAAGNRAGPAGELLAAIGRSLGYGAVATLANVIFAVLLVIGVPDRWRTVKRVLTVLSIIPIAIPGTVLALALLQSFAASGPFGAGPALAQTAAILPFAYFVRNLPILVQAADAAKAQLSSALPEASRTLGAGPMATLWRVTFPLMLPGIAAGAVMAFLAATGEFVASIMLYTPRTMPASVAIYGEYVQSEYGTAAAAGTLLMAVVLLAAAGAGALTSRRRLFPAAP